MKIVQYRVTTIGEITIYDNKENPITDKQIFDVIIKDYEDVPPTDIEYEIIKEIES